MTVGPPSYIKSPFLKTLARPPRSGCFSTNVTLYPFALNLSEAAKPPKPDPITIIFLPLIFMAYSN